MSEYPAFPKIPRFNRAAVITEKIDGTNGQIFIRPDLDGTSDESGEVYAELDELDGPGYFLRAGSRSRWLTLKDDNYGFARWVYENASELVKLGTGSHFGEWWGSGIQRRYGIGEKRFSLFNVARWPGPDATSWPDVPGLGVVPVLCTVEAEDMPRVGERVASCLENLRQLGSFAAPGYMNPEGVVIFHTASRQLYKVTLENDEAPKGLTSK